AEAEKRVDRAVLLLEAELELGLEVVQLIQVAHGVIVALRSGPPPGLSRARKGPDRARKAARGRTPARGGGGAGPSGRARRLSRRRRGADRGRSSAGHTAAPAGPARAHARPRAGGRGARAGPARCPARPPR